MIHPQGFADNTLGILNRGIDVAGSNVNELSADIRKEHLEPQPRICLGLQRGLGWRTQQYTSKQCAA
jgi:hypothetical protein